MTAVFDPSTLAQTNEIVIGVDALGLGSNTAVIGATLQSAATIYGVLNLPSGLSAAGATFSGNISAGNIVNSWNGSTGTVVFTNYVASFNGVTGAVQGVSAAVAGTGISVSGATGSVTITNTGVQSFNGLTGAVTGVTVGGTNVFTALNSFSAGISAAGGVTFSGTFSGTTGAFSKDIIVNSMTIGRGGGDSDTNLAVGVGALGSNDTGIYNTAIGAAALPLVVEGGENTAIGYGALEVLVGGSENIAIGRSALGSLENANSNTAIGRFAMYYAIDAEANIAIGGGALLTNVSGSYNVAIGENCLTSAESTGNVANGRSALQSILTGNYNVALGYDAGRRRTTGAVALTSATESIFIGYSARASANAMTREIVIGSNALGLGSDTTVIGVTSTLGNRIFGVASTGVTAPTIASAATIAPTKTITFISGTTAIVTITAPSLIATTGGQITLIPTGIFTTTAAGNIALASTAVVSKALIMTYDAGTAKWYPSY